MQEKRLKNSATLNTELIKVKSELKTSTELKVEQEKSLGKYCLKH